MSLRDFRKPRLIDKIEAQAREAEEKRERLEIKDVQRVKIIKKKTPKN